MDKTIQTSFPITDINRLAERERHTFMPIYQMHKWFARRASCVFRAILLGASKPAGTDIMAEFYRNHTHDPDTNGLVVLDPFMGGGTTVVEAMRLGCKIVGIDLNPVAWFVVQTQIRPVDPASLQAAFDLLAARPVAWSGKSVQETLLDQYRTACPQCGDEADIIYTYWVKSAICTNPTCGKQVPLFSDYRVSQRAVSVRYWRDVKCPRCEGRFDWELEAATLIGQPELMLNSPRFSAGQGRSETRWAFSDGPDVECPWCHARVSPTLPSPRKLGTVAKPARKRVPLAVLLCPHCGEVWQWRGPLPDQVTCPTCHGKPYKPLEGNLIRGGSYVCPHCGTRDQVIHSLRRLPEERLLPMHPYALEGYCPHCARPPKPKTRNAYAQGRMFEDRAADDEPDAASDRAYDAPDGPNRLMYNGGKFYRRITAADLRRIQDVEVIWEREREHLPYPTSPVPVGEKTKSGLIAHHYRFWWQLFNARQLLCLSTLLQGIDEEPEQSVKEQLLAAFSMTLEANNMFTWHITSRNTPGGLAPGGILRRHDFAPKMNICEQSVWGTISGNNTFTNRMPMLFKGLEYGREPYDLQYDERNAAYKRVKTGETVVLNSNVSLHCADSRMQVPTVDRPVDLVITDPPYAGNVNYAELADFFYVWLRLILSKTYRHFAPEYTPKEAEIIQNPTRGKSSQDFAEGLAQVFEACRSVLRDEGLLVFTFHHAEESAWEALLQAVCDAGFEIDSVYPIRSEREESLHLMDKTALSYDLIHVCRKRTASNGTAVANGAAPTERRSWAGVRQEIRRRARAEIREIEAGRYGAEPLAPSDVQLVLIGKCLELYSRHYEAIYDAQGNRVTLHDALKEIRSMVDQLVTRDRPLPPELEDIDAESRIYLLTLCQQREIKSDDVHKATRGGVVSPDDLLDAGLMIKGRTGRGRTYEVKQPAERFQELLGRFGASRQDGAARQTEVQQLALLPELAPPPRVQGRVLFIDQVHFLMGLVEGGENVLPWLERFAAERPRLRAACTYLAEHNRAFEPTLRKILDLLEPLPLLEVKE
ncbi:MAG: DUF1156 domain-containing protein [Anaerolineae bacterium]|nr:DUF1156 domain-containing protein [Anaerolineae bacterium]